MAHLKNQKTGEQTILQSGDVIMWFRDSECFSFKRPSDVTTLICDSGDDKFWLRIRNLADFHTLASMIAATHGFSFKIYEFDHETDLKAYQFE